MEKFKDVESQDNMDRINSDLYDIQNSMMESFDLLLDKEKKIGGTALVIPQKSTIRLQG